MWRLYSICDYDVLTIFKSNRFMGEEPECTALLSLSHLMSLNELYHWVMGQDQWAMATDNFRLL
jgi:hypothetical protein